MYWSGWEMGAVEAISLSILVGSSVDYCVHLVEGYLLAGENLPLHQAEVSSGLPTALHSFLLCPLCHSAVMIGKGGCVLAPSEYPWGIWDLLLVQLTAPDSELVHLSAVNSDEGFQPTWLSLSWWSQLCPKQTIFMSK